MSLPLKDRLERLVPRHVALRGADYWRQGRVEVTHREYDLAIFDVRGSQGMRYEVSLRLDGDDLIVSCECPYIENEFDTCKHIWAAILEASRKSWFEEARTLSLEDVEVPPPPTRGKPAPTPEWKRELEMLRGAGGTRGRTPLPTGSVLQYSIDIDMTLASSAIALNVLVRTPKKSGGLSKPRPFTLQPDDIRLVSDERDREILAMAAGATTPWAPPLSQIRLHWPLPIYLLPRVCETGRLEFRKLNQVIASNIAWDSGDPWTFTVAINRDESSKHYVVSGHFERAGETLAMNEPLLLISGGLLFRNSSIARLDDGGAFEWIALLRRKGTLRIPFKEAQTLTKILASVRRPSHVSMPDELRLTDVRGVPVPCLTIRQNRFEDGFEPSLSFIYEGVVAGATDDPRPFFEEKTRRIIHRDLNVERAAAERLKSLGASYDIEPKRLQTVIRVLLAEGWRIDGEKGTYRSATDFRLEVSSGIDWFDLSGEATFGDERVALPALLAAARKGESMLTLRDGSLALMPDSWLETLRPLIELAADEKEGRLRYRPSQVGLLDALLAARNDVHFDDRVRAARERLGREIKSGVAPKSFVGTLRDYQRDGVGWFAWLRELAFGGCLADDMGLGKTVQVLAMLDARRASGESKHRPSLIVVPRSLIFNWKEEAARFTPQLRVIDSSGIGRARSAEAFADVDVVLTTYGTLRQDIAWLSEIEFDYAILDEAQAIKTATSLSSKAARLLRAQYRLALSGTPIENHLGELWSLFEFLNPGMFGKQKGGQLPALLRPKDDAQRSALARAIRPFILRRTKEQVARELPPSVEQTIHCELGEMQRRLYDELRAHYRQSLLAKVAANGMAKSKIHILEALLRLRQAACHPGLVQKERAKEESAKLDSLMSELEVVLAEEHKVLVFSQFTSFLSIVRARLDALKIDYCYLDGKTRLRDREVQRFQSTDGPSLFLISLKAGGLGLNLTAAEYVFLLDPWWNPAVEAQAIDRAHRIGQQRRVFAYRLVAKDTIEDKILELQNKKRALADAIISEDNSVLRGLTAEDLDLLLS